MILSFRSTALFAGFLALATALFASPPAFAHGPTPQRFSLKIHINAAPQDVWRMVENPASLAGWHPLVARSSTNGTGRGAQRTVEFVSGGHVVDGIDDINADRRNIRWRLSQENIDVMPVSYYTNDLMVTEADGGSDVTWRASFFRADTTNEPEERYSDEAAIKAMESYAREGLAGLKEFAEAGQ